MRAEDKYETEWNAARVQQEVKKTDRCETLEVKPVSVWEMRAGFSPRVCFRCEDALHESFRWHPFHRQHGTPTLPVIARPEHTNTCGKGHACITVWLITAQSIKKKVKTSQIQQLIQCFSAALSELWSSRFFSFLTCCCVRPSKNSLSRREEGRRFLAGPTRAPSEPFLMLPCPLHC